MKLKYQTWRGQSAYWQWSPVPDDLPLSLLTSHAALLAPPWLFLSVSTMGASIPFCMLCIISNCKYHVIVWQLLLHS